MFEFYLNMRKKREAGHEHKLLQSNKYKNYKNTMCCLKMQQLENCCKRNKTPQEILFNN